MQRKLNVSLLKVVIINAHNPTKRLVLRIDNPLGLPLAAPKGLVIQVDATDVNLEALLCVETERSASRALFVRASHVGLKRLLNAGSNKKRYA